jgi:hypothetical protein
MLDGMRNEKGLPLHRIHFNRTLLLNLPVLWVVLTLVGFLSSCNEAPTQSQEVWYIRKIAGQIRDEIVARNLQNQAERVILRAPDGTVIENAAISPNGEHIIYVLGDIQSDKAALWLATADGQNAQQITDPQGGISALWLGSDDILINFIHEQYLPYEAGEWAIYHVPIHKTQSLQTESTLYLCATAQSSDIAPRAATYQGPSAQLGRFELAQDMLKLVPDITLDLEDFELKGHSCLAWSRDGKSIAFYGYKEPERNISNLFVQTRESKSVKQLTDFGKIYNSAALDRISVSPNGEWIIFSVALSGQINQDAVQNKRYVGLAKADNGQVTLLGQRQATSDFIWSPDSRFVITRLADKDAPVSELGGQLYLIEIPDGALKQLTSEENVYKAFDVRPVQ